MVAYWDKNCINRYANRAYLEWFGVSPSELHGKHIRLLLGEALYQRNLPYISKALQGEAQLFERDIPRPDGKGIRHSIAHYLPNVAEHSVEGFYVIVHDITEVIEGRNQLQQAREQQMRMDRLASLGLMVAGVAHDLNTPLGAAMLAIHKLMEELTQFKVAVDSGLRKSDVERLSSHFDDGLAMASRYLARSAEIIRQFKQVASDRAGAERRIFIANDVINDVIHLMDGQIRKHQARIALELQPDVELDSYPGIVGQVLQNLVENSLIHAFELNAPGTIHIAMHDAPGADAVFLIITDNGKGIPDAIREQIWDPFFTTRRGEGGTGLGLHIVQRLVTELLGGDIVQGSPTHGYGSKFVVTIPKHAPTVVAE
jgi:PAS domain S-box-containing protein